MKNLARAQFLDLWPRMNWWMKLRAYRLVYMFVITDWVLQTILKGLWMIRPCNYKPPVKRGWDE